MPHYLLFYDVVPDSVERRAAFRSEHLVLGPAYQACGELILAGALANPADGAVLVFRGESPSAVEAFVAADPYVHERLVMHWRVREWTVAVATDTFCG